MFLVFRSTRFLAIYMYMLNKDQDQNTFSLCTHTCDIASVKDYHLQNCTKIFHFKYVDMGAQIKGFEMALE